MKIIKLVNYMKLYLTGLNRIKILFFKLKGFNNFLLGVFYNWGY